MLDGKVMTSNAESKGPTSCRTSREHCGADVLQVASGTSTRSSTSLALLKN
jgi:hypothetical protein